MDPAATLKDAEHQLNAGCLDEAKRLLNVYRNWRHTQHGFEPPGGDATYTLLDHQLSQKLKKERSSHV